MTVHDGPECELCCASNLGAKWRWMVSTTVRPLYLRERDLVPIELGGGGGCGPCRKQIWNSRQIFVEVPVIKFLPNSIRLEPR